MPSNHNIEKLEFLFCDLLGLELEAFYHELRSKGIIPKNENVPYPIEDVLGTFFVTLAGYGLEVIIDENNRIDTIFITLIPLENEGDLKMPYNGLLTPFEKTDLTKEDVIMTIGTPHFSGGDGKMLYGVIKNRPYIKYYYLNCQIVFTFINDKVRLITLLDPFWYPEKD